MATEVRVHRHPAEVEPARTEDDPRAVRWVALLLLAEVGVFAGSTVPGVRQVDGFHPLLDGWLQGTGYVTAALLACLVARSPSRSRAWAWIAGALVLRATGFVLFLALVRDRTPVPVPSIADVAWLATPVVLAVGILSLGRRRSRAFDVRVAVDAVVGALAVAAIGLALLLPTLRTLTAPGTPSAALVTNLAYPLSDAGLLFVVLGVAAACSWRPPRPLLLISAAVVGFAVCDGLYVYRSAAGTFRPGTLLPALSLAATASLALAGCVGPGAAPSRRRTSLVLAPVVAALACIGVLVVAADHELPDAAIALATAGILLSVARTAFVVRELQRLAARLREQERLVRDGRERAAAEVERLGAILEGITDHAIIGGTIGGAITFFSPCAERMLGYASEEVVGVHDPGLFLPEDQFRTWLRATGSGRDGAAGPGPGRVWTFRRKDGTSVPVRLTTTRVGGGEYVGIARDATREMTLARYRATREALTPILVPDRPLDDVLEDAIGVVARSMGWDVGILWLQEADRLRPRHLWRRAGFSSQDWEDAVRGLRMAPGDGVTGHLWHAGGSFWVERLSSFRGRIPLHPVLSRDLDLETHSIVVVPLVGTTEPDSPLGIMQLIGPSRPRDDELMDLLEIIAGTIGRHLERTRAAEQLRGARDAAELANRTKSEFVSRVSHELRTPLNAILGFAQLLEDDERDERQRERIEQVLIAGGHLASMIDDLLDLARVERGELRMSVGPVSATDVLGEVLDLIGPLVAGRGLSLEVDAHEGLFRHVAADYQRLRQVLLNLVSNAVKYNRPGGSISIAFDASDPDRLRFLVSDTGRGIAEDRRPGLFRPFERLGAESGLEEGTGLGLFVSHGLAEAMGGTLTLTASSAAGSTFALDLPRADPLPAPQDAPAPAGAALPGACPPATILHVEDNPANRRLVRDALARSPGVEVIEATDGAAGLEAAGSRHPDLVLLDLHLPGVDGTTVLRRLRSDERTARIPVIVVSASGEAQLEARCIDAGAAAYLTKPLDLPRLLTEITSALEREQAPGVA